MTDEPKPRCSWFDSIPWWLWAAVAVTQALLVPGRLNDFAAAVSRSERTEEGLMAAGAAVWSLLATMFAVRAWQLRPRP